MILMSWSMEQLNLVMHGRWFLFIISLAIKQGHTEAYNIAYNNASYTKM